MACDREKVIVGNYAVCAVITNDCECDFSSLKLVKHPWKMWKLLKDVKNLNIRVLTNVGPTM